MWPLKLQYEFYNLRFYDTERNFSHQGQRQEWNQKAALMAAYFQELPKY